MPFIILNRVNEEIVVTGPSGGYLKTLRRPGLHMLIPFFGKATRVSTSQVDLKDELKFKTADNVFVSLPVTLQVQVTDSKKYVCNNIDGPKQATAVAGACLRKLFAAVSVANLARDANDICEKAMDETRQFIGDNYGMEILDLKTGTATLPAALPPLPSASAAAAAAVREERAAATSATVQSLTEGTGNAVRVSKPPSFRKPAAV